jgi:AIG2-like family
MTELARAKQTALADAREAGATETVWGFFYGSYINLSVLAEVNLEPRDVEVARLLGWAIRIRPLANIYPSERDVVFGILGRVTHAELGRLYQHAEHVLGGVYLPRPVMVERRDGSLRTALCFVASSMTEAAPDAAYVARIVGPATELGFPDWYVDHLQHFAELSRDREVGGRSCGSSWPGQGRGGGTP